MSSCPSITYNNINTFENKYQIKEKHKNIFSEQQKLSETYYNYYLSVEF